MAKSRKTEPVVVVDPVGPAEAADILDVASYYINRYRTRKTNPLPAPVVELACGPLWEKQTILDFKGGVDKAKAVRNGTAKSK